MTTSGRYDATQTPTFGALLRQGRHARGFTQEELAERAEMSVRQLGYLEQDRKTPRPGTIRRLADALDLSFNDRTALLAAAAGHGDGRAHFAVSPEPTLMLPEGTSGQAHSPKLPGGFLGARPAGSLVGRETEHARLVSMVEAAAQGIGRLVTIVGEPGVGKTRMAQELTLDLEARGFVVATGRCFERQQTIPYAPFLGAVPLLYAAAPAPLRQQAAEQWPYLAPLLPDELPPVHDTRTDLQGDQLRVFRALTRFLLALAAEHPVAMLFDDLHWADVASLDLLRHLALDTRDAPVFLAGIHRPLPHRHPLRTVVHNLARDGLVDQLAMRLLDRAGTASLLDVRLADAEVSNHLVDVVHEQAEGNPFFTVEIVRALVERGDIAIRDGVWEVRGEMEIAVPESVRAVIDERVGRLPEGAQTVLCQASVLGHAVTAEELLGISGREAEQVEEALEAAAGAELLQERGGEAYAFSHVLVQQALYADLPGPRKRRLHLAAGRALEAIPERRRRPPAELAWHFRQGDEVERALHWTVLAGDQAKTAFAHGEAERHYQLALQLAKETGDEAREAEALERLGDVLERLLRHDEARASYVSALALAPPRDRFALSRVHRKIGDTWNAFGEGFDLGNALQAYGTAEQLLGDAPDEPDAAWQQGWIDVQFGRATAYSYVGRAAETMDLLRSLRTVVQQGGTPEQRVDVFYTLAHFTLQRERYGVCDEALGYILEAVEAARQLGDVRRTVAVRFGLGFQYLWHGDLGEAEETLRETLHAAEKIDDLQTQAQCLSYLTTVFRKRGQVDSVRDHVPRCQAAAIAASTPQYVAMADAHLSWVAWRDGDLEEAEAKARAALDRWEDHGVFLYRLVYWMAIWPLLGVALAQNRLEDAVDHARALIASTRQPMPDNLTAELAEATAAWDHGDAAASTHLRAAVKLAQEGGYL